MSERVKTTIQEIMKFVDRGNRSDAANAGIQAIAGLESAAEALSTLAAEVDSLQRQIESHQRQITTCSDHFSRHQHVAAGDMFFRDPADPTPTPPSWSERYQQERAKNAALVQDWTEAKDARNAAERRLDSIRTVHQEVFAELRQAGPDIADIVVHDLALAVRALHGREKRRTAAGKALAVAVREHFHVEHGGMPGAMPRLFDALNAFEKEG